MIAVNTIRREPHYRSDAFDAGLERVGYRIERGGRPKSREDLLVLWNRMAANEHQAAEWESRGGTVLVCENAYLQPSKWSMYAIGVHGHCGSGWYPIGDEDRFSGLGFALDSWRDTGGYILVCGQRGIGSRTMASPARWEKKVTVSLRGMGHKDIKVREHPGRVAQKTTLESDLAGASICLVWSSSCGVLALTKGVPVVYCAPRWICQDSAGNGLGNLTVLQRDDSARRRAMHKMSHGQWSVDEIQAGEPFRRILEKIGDAKW